MNKPSPLWFAFLLAACGEAVSPSTRPVTFHVTRADSTVLDLPSVAVRAESADGQVVTGTTASDGSVWLRLAENTRWDVTFAGREVDPLSILGLRPTAVSNTLLVQMTSKASGLRIGGWLCAVPSNAELHQLRVRVRRRVLGAMHGPRDEVGPFACVQSAERLPDAPDTIEYVYQFASYPNAPPLELWFGEVSFPAGGASPWPERGVFHRISPRPTTDASIELDYAEAEPSPPSTRIGVELPSTGIVSAQSAKRSILEYSDGAIWQDYGNALRWPSSVLVGFAVKHFLASALQPEIEPRVFHREWLSAASPRSAHTRHTFEITRPGGLPTELRLSVDPTTIGPVVVPETTELDVVGTRVDNVELRVRGGFSQAGFRVYTQATPTQISQVLWTGWLFDGVTAQSTQQFRVPRLPDGYRLPTPPAAYAFHVEAFMTTLPREQPGYGYYPQSAAQSTVAAWSRAIPAGDR